MAVTGTLVRKVRGGATAGIAAFFLLGVIGSACGDAEEATPATPATGAADTAAATATVTNTPRPTDTPAPANTPTPTEPAAPTGSRRDDAVPPGMPLEIAGWLITVNGVVPDGNDAVRAENMFNEPPQPGRQFFIASISATYQGSADSSALFSDVTLKAVGAAGVSYSSYGNSCGVIPDALDDFREVFKGGTISGNICWQIASGDASSLVMYGEASFSFDSKRAWWKLAAD